jgi:hypothetical protein
VRYLELSFCPHLHYPQLASTLPKRKALEPGHHANAGKKVCFLLLSSTRRLNSSSAKIEKDVKAPPLANLVEPSSDNSAVSSSAHAELPATCPSNYCNDPFPHDLSDYLLSLEYAFKQRIYQAICDKHRIDDYLCEARIRGWDLQINREVVQKPHEPHAAFLRCAKKAACGTVRLLFPHRPCIQTLPTVRCKLLMLIPAIRWEVGAWKMAFFWQRHGHSRTAAVARPRKMTSK